MFGVRRREFITLVRRRGSRVADRGGAQQAGPMRRIGVMATLAETYPMGKAYMVAFREGLQALGWSEDRNLRLDIRWPTPDRVYSSEPQRSSSRCNPISSLVETHRPLRPCKNERAPSLSFS